MSTIKEAIWAIVVISGFLGVICGPVLNAGFVLTDDHEIISIASPAQVHPQARPAVSLWKRLTEEEPHRGRLRPLHYVSRYVLASLLGTNAAAWHIVFMLSGIITALLLYAAFRTLGVNFILSIFFVLLVILSPRPPGTASVWICLGANETLGVLFTGAALLAAAKATLCQGNTNWGIVLVISVLLAGLSKESFVLTIPAMMYVRVVLWMNRQRCTLDKAVRALLPTLLGLALIFLCLIAAILTTAGFAERASEGAAALAAAVTTKQVLWSVCTVLYEGGLFIPVLLIIIALIASIIAGKRIPFGEKCKFIEVCIFGLMWLIPQMLLYRTRGGITGRFSLPAVIAIAAINILALLWLQKSGRKRLYALGIVWLITWALLTFSETITFVWRQRADALALNRMTRYIGDNVPFGKALVIVAEPADNYESSISLIYHIGYTGRADLPIYILPAVSKAPCNQKQNMPPDALIKSSYFANRHNPMALDPAEIGCVIILSPVDQLSTHQASWLNSQRCKLVEFSEHCPGSKLRKLKLLYPDSVTYRILIKP